jgi:diguanylate cyclase (GGDEF)-like protein
MTIHNSTPQTKAADGKSRAPLATRLAHILRTPAQALKSIRARLVVLALIVLVPLMMDRVRVLEDSRAHRLADVQDDAMMMARQGAQRQAEIVANAETMLRSAAQFYAMMSRKGMSCAEFLATNAKASWAKTIAVADQSGKIICTTESAVQGINVSDRSYFKDALESGGFAISDYIVARGTNKPVIVVAHAASISGEKPDAVVIMSVNLQWLANFKQNVSETESTSTFVIDDHGNLLAASDEAKSLIGKTFKDHPLTKAMLAQDDGKGVQDDFAGTRRIYGFTRIPGARAHLAVGISEKVALHEIDRDIKLAYLQLVGFVIAILLGAWLAGEFMIVRPISAFARVTSRLGKGDLGARVQAETLATEFGPLAHAFNDMAAQLAGREHGLLADNNRLTVLASVDTVSGLANRRGFNSRMDFEWLRLAAARQSLGLLMIDVDHFKQFNDTYGHPEGDACLKQIGQVLASFANEEAGFAARYGGEEFLLLLPDADVVRTSTIGEGLRLAIEELGIPHQSSPFGCVTVSIGAANVDPRDDLAPDTLVEAADAGLYAAKRRGRNQVVGHGTIEALPILTSEDAASDLAPAHPANG